MRQISCFFLQKCIPELLSEIIDTVVIEEFLMKTTNYLFLTAV